VPESSRASNIKREELTLRSHNYRREPFLHTEGKGKLRHGCEKEEGGGDFEKNNRVWEKTTS